MRAEEDVVAHAELGEYLTSLRHERNAQCGNLVCCKLLHWLLVEHDCTGDRTQQSGDGAHSSGFARATPAAGSSSNSTRGPVASARAISTRRRSTCGRALASAASGP